jgi:hypothetical protein
MNANDCRIVRREIDVSELGQRLSESMEMHVSACAACAQFRTERAQLRELVGSLKPVAAPADFDMRLRARIAREKDARARQPFIFRLALTTPAIAVAALIVLTIASIVWITQRNHTQTGSPKVATVNQANDQPATPGTSPTNPSNAGNQSNELLVAKAPETLKRGPGTRNVPRALPMTDNVQPEVSDLNATAAPSVHQTGDRAGAVSFSAPSKPMVVSVQDANGATHKILLPPISFGSQRLDNRTAVSMTDRKDW